MKEILLNILGTETNIKVLENVGDFKGNFLILHGWGGKSDSWIEVSEMLAMDGFKVFIPDLPAHGKTNLDRVFMLSDYGDFIVELIKKLKIDNFNLIGHSNGGRISLDLLSKNKINPDKIFLIGSAGLRPTLTFKQKVFTYFAKFFKKTISFFGPKVLFYSSKKRSGKNKLKSLFYRLIGGHDYLRASEDPILKQTFLNVLNIDLTEEIKEIDKKVNLIWGSKDTYTPLYLGEKMSKLLKNSTFTVLDGEKHGIHLQNPKSLFKAIKNNL